MPPRTATTAGRYRRSRRSPCPADKEAGKSHQPAVSPSRMRSEAVPKRRINKAPSGRASNQVKRQHNMRTQRPRRRSQPLQRADTGEHDCRRVSLTVKGGQSQHPAAISSGTRPDAAHKYKTKSAPSGQAVRDTHCTGRAQTTTTVVRPHGLKRRANCNTSPYRAWIHI